MMMDWQFWKPRDYEQDEADAYMSTKSVHGSYLRLLTPAETRKVNDADEDWNVRGQLTARVWFPDEAA